MQTGLHRTLARLKQPEYTGENRCLPCTTLNIAIGVVLASFVAIFTEFYLGLAVFGISLVIIYFRGYLVPRTPSLTKRYLPDSILAKFDTTEHSDETVEVAESTESIEAINPETLLLENNIIKPCEDIDDLCLTESIQSRWEAEMDDVIDGDRVKQLAAFLDVNVTTVHYLPRGDGHIQVYVDGDLIGKWESDSAVVADIAGARVLAEEIPEWELMPIHHQSQLTNGIRAFLEFCPACSAELTLGEESVESCCRSHEVYAITCESCDDRLLEIAQ